ncbi:MAG: SH3 domain-containing protein [Gammaproteobacteria bacterium]|nr:SH3 domain-containing protein [Gammaproteobacteria bacterium]
MTRASLLILLLSLATSGITQAETVYVSGANRVGVRAEAGSKDTPLTVVQRGDALELLENNGDYWRVRTQNGVEGWIKSIYAVHTPPTKAQNDKPQIDKPQIDKPTSDQEVHKAEQSIIQLRNQLEQQLAENRQLQSRVEVLNTEVYNLHQSLSDIRGDDPTRHRDWLFLFIALAALAGLGFTLGILWNKHQVAKKLGGHSL